MLGFRMKRKFGGLEGFWFGLRFLGLHEVWS